MFWDSCCCHKCGIFYISGSLTGVTKNGGLLLQPILSESKIESFFVGYEGQSFGRMYVKFQVLLSLTYIWQYPSLQSTFNIRKYVVVYDVVAIVQIIQGMILLSSYKCAGVLPPCSRFHWLTLSIAPFTFRWKNFGALWSSNIIQDIHDLCSIAASDNTFCLDGMFSLMSSYFFSCIYPSFTQYNSSSLSAFTTLVLFVLLCAPFLITALILVFVQLDSQSTGDPSTE